MNRTQRRGIWIASSGLLLIAIVGAGILISSTVDRANREAQVAADLRDYPSASFEGVPDKQLAQSFGSKCEAIAAGRTLADEVASAHTNWAALEDTSPISLDEYLANVRAIYTAAEANC